MCVGNRCGSLYALRDYEPVWAHRVAEDDATASSARLTLSSWRRLLRVAWRTISSNAKIRLAATIWSQVDSHGAAARTVRRDRLENDRRRLPRGTRPAFGFVRRIVISE